jgi:hypothetical protein
MFFLQMKPILSIFHMWKVKYCVRTKNQTMYFWLYQNSFLRFSKFLYSREYLKKRYLNTNIKKYFFLFFYITKSLKIGDQLTFLSKNLNLLNLKTYNGFATIEQSIHEPDQCIRFFPLFKRQKFMASR